MAKNWRRRLWMSPRVNDPSLVTLVWIIKCVYPDPLVANFLDPLVAF